MNPKGPFIGVSKAKLSFYVLSHRAYLDSFNSLTLFVAEFSLTGLVKLAKMSPLPRITSKDRPHALLWYYCGSIILINSYWSTFREGLGEHR
jgi:hypothetical protein